MKKVINLYNPIINIQTYILTANDHIEKNHKKNTHEKHMCIFTLVFIRCQSYSGTYPIFGFVNLNRRRSAAQNSKINRIQFQVYLYS